MKKITDWVADNKDATELNSEECVNIIFANIVNLTSELAPLLNLHALESVGYLTKYSHSTDRIHTDIVIKLMLLKEFYLILL